jgi:exopolysaccharide biosynthesis polyprenyl glycosylphosphotransferase
MLHNAIAKEKPDFNTIEWWLPSEEFPKVGLRKSFLTSEKSYKIKTFLDRSFSFIVSILLIPFYIFMGLFIKINSKGPVFFKQERVGFDGKPFEILKFRTMYANAEEMKESLKKFNEASGPVFKMEKDPRITSVGRFLRKTGLDELPQLWNVVVGDMSLVGPRPERPQFVNEFKKDIPAYMLRHKMKAGITGWAQVNGWRGETDTLDKMENRVKFDLQYIKNWSVLLDLKIIFLTILKGFTDPNVY